MSPRSMILSSNARHVHMFANTNAHRRTCSIAKRLAERLAGHVLDANRLHELNHDLINGHETSERCFRMSIDRGMLMLRTMSLEPRARRLLLP